MARARALTGPLSCAARAAVPMRASFNTHSDASVQSPSLPPDSPPANETAAARNMMPATSFDV
jgi:hypothetical protein